MGEDSNHQPSQGCRFPDWPVKLQADGSLTPELRASYRVTILGFLEFCRRRRTAPAVAAAREYVEVIWLFEALEGTPRLMAELMFGSGVRLMELLRLRVKDVDLERGQLIVRGGKGGQDQVGTDIRTVQDLLGHKDVATTQIYTHVMKKPGMGVRSPLDSS